MSRQVSRAVSFFCAFLLCALTAQGQTLEQRTARYFDSIRNSPPQLESFLRAMPKGGDLHNHLSGAVYAESYIQYAAHDKLCFDRKARAFAEGPCDPPRGLAPAEAALTDGALRSEIIDAFSMRAFQPYSEPLGSESGEDHFFNSFGRFHLVSRDHTGEMLADVISRAGHQNESYMELMIGLDHVSAGLGAKVGWTGNFDEMRERLTAADIHNVIAPVEQALDAAEAEKNRLLRCDDAAHADPGCKVTVRYIYEVYRGTPPEQVFAEIMSGFEIVHEGDRRYVSVNPVMPEDGPISMRDYDLHMRMFGYFHKLYPDVRLTEHAGELAAGLVPPSGLRFHIRNAVEIGAAQRIGHGVDVMEEDRPLDLLREMARKKIAVEICLTSNDLILGISGSRHPFPVYLKYGVPVAISTDDEGVSRSDMTHEYLRAVESYSLHYPELKRIVRNSIEYSFVQSDVKAKLLVDLDKRFRQFEASSRP